MSVQVNKCPFCGGTEFINAEQNSYGGIYGEGKMIGCILRHVVCRNCGSIVHSYVDDPEKLLKKKDRK